MLRVKSGRVLQKEDTTEDDTNTRFDSAVAHRATPELPHAVHDLAASHVNLLVQRDSNVAGSATPTLSFLGLPREIRNEIYHYLLQGGLGREITCDPQTKHTATLTLLRINRQVAAEVLDVLRSMNLWITLELQTKVVDSRMDDLLEGILSNTTLSCIRLRRTEFNIMEACAILSITISLNDQIFVDYGRPPRKVAKGHMFRTSIVAFAYSRSTYERLCPRLRKFSRAFGMMHIYVNPRTKVPKHRVKSDLLIPLCGTWHPRRLFFSDSSGELHKIQIQ